jgi:hypothetical protein
MNSRGRLSRERLSAALVIALFAASLRADAMLDDLSGTCRISAASKPGKFELRLERGNCEGGGNCNNSDMSEPADAFTGIALADLGREGAHLDAVMTAEAGTLRCSGSVHGGELAGSFTFEPDRGFIDRMREVGITGFGPDTSVEKLEAYALFRVTRDWVVSLQKAGVTGIDADNLIALRIFGVDADYVHSLGSLGYPPPAAEKLIALRVQGVDPAEVKRVQAMGYHPTLDELVQMRIFKVTPDFIERMKARGFDNLTIAKLVQIRIFKLAD